jgi:hypothetical protein
MVTIIVSDMLSINDTEAKGGHWISKGMAPGIPGNVIRWALIGRALAEVIKKAAPAKAGTA